MPSYSDLSSPCTCPLLLPLLLIAEAQRTLVVAARLGSPRRLTRWSAARRRHRVRGRPEADLIIWNGLVFIPHTDWSKCTKVISRLPFPFGCKLENRTITYLFMYSFAMHCIAMQRSAIPGKYHFCSGHCGQTSDSNTLWCLEHEYHTMRILWTAKRRDIFWYGLLWPW